MALYPMLMQDCWQALISNCIGALIGMAVFVAVAKYRYNLQLYGFLVSLFRRYHRILWVVSPLLQPWAKSLSLYYPG